MEAGVHRDGHDGLAQGDVVGLKSRALAAEQKAGSAAGGDAIPQSRRGFTRA